MIILEKDQVFEKLTMPVCIRLMREAFTLLEQGRAIQPIRAMARFPQGEVFGFMPAYLGAEDYFGAKVVNAMPQNAGTGYPSHNGYVMVFESRHGQCVGLADAGAITQIRTGAVSAVATDLLARKDAANLALIGAGAQARSHLEAILCVRPAIRQVRVYDIRPEAARRFKEEMEARFPVDITICSDVQQTVTGADIICTLTPSKQAYLEADWVAPGAHVNAVGTFSPTTREVTSELVRRSRLYADQIEAMQKESGEYLVPLQEGLITPSHIRGSIGQLLLGTAQGRTNDQEITLFDALGLATEDVICARWLCTSADTKS